jgi:sugar lactone lactonase YvrE
MPVIARMWPVWVGFAAGLLALAFGARGQGSQPGELPPLISLSLQAREARLAGDNKRWLERGQQALQLAPDHPDLLISVARAFAANGRFDDAATRLADAVRRGGGFDLAKLPEFTSAADTPQLRALREQALRNMVPVAAPEIFHVLQNESLRTEGITWDPVGRHLYIGSLNGEIWRVDLNGKLERFAGAGSGLREVLGLKVDAERRLLWAATGVFPDLLPTGESKKDVGTTGLHAYDIETGKRVRECGLDERPTLHGFNDMALAKNGTVYVSDSPNSSIYQLSSSGCKLDRVLQDLAMSFPNGIVLTPDQSRLYVAHVEGISAIDVRTGRRLKLAVPSNAAVNSIDGLVWDQNDLLGIQSSPYLARVARIRLGEDGLSIREVATMSSRPPPGLSSRTGVVVGDQFYMTAEFGDTGADPGRVQPRSHILRTPVR